MTRRMPPPVFRGLSRGESTRGYNPIARVTTAIRQHRLCLHCVASAALIDKASASAALTTIGTILQLRRYEAGRCHACSAVGPVFALDAPLH